MGSTVPFTVLAPLGGDARHEASLVETTRGRFVLKVLRPQVVTPPTFLDHAKSISTLNHAGVRTIRAAGALGDGRRYALVDVVDEPTLATAAPLTVPRAIEVGIALADTLSVMHHAGIAVGAFEAADVYVGASTRLDASLSGLDAKATPTGDTEQLKRLVLGCAPFDPPAQERVLRANTASQVKATLMALQLRHSDTAIAQGAVAEVEVVEPDLCGNQLGAWKLEKIIGEGAMGRVYLGVHNRIGRRAAVKVLKGEHASNAELVHRFIQEAQAVNAIKNEHIVEVYDFGELTRPDGSRLVYCVMELLEGEALAETLNRGPISVQRTASIGRQLAQALAAAHHVGVVHRDIKPENIFLHRRGSDGDFVKVLDFGVAKLLKPIGDLPSTGTLAGIVVGTPEYMAPEQALGGTVDVRSDLYAAGLVMYELLTAMQPFQGDTFGKLVVEITQRPVPPMPARTLLGEALPGGLVRVILKCLQKDPEARFQSGEALAAALEPYAQGLVDEPVAPPAPEEPLRVTRSRAPVLVVVALVSAAAGLAAVVFWPAASTPSVVATPTEVAAAPAAGPVPAVAPAPTAPQPSTLVVATTPSGATVTRVDTGQVLGRSPFSVALDQRGAVTLALSLAGYETERRDVNLSTNTTLTVDLRPTRKEEPRAPKKTPKKASVNGTVDPFDQ